jgi:uncharacterized membrane protein AbrB (regulator of aidB expression)
MRLNVMLLALLGTACVAPHAQQKTANYIAVTPNETDRLQITVTRNSLVWSGYIEASAKQPDGTVKVRRIAVTGDVSTDGVPASITIPSSVVGVPDLTLGCLFDRSLNLHLFGDNTRRFPRLMYLVK